VGPSRLLTARRSLILVAALLALTAAACDSGDGENLPPAGPDQTKSILTTTSAATTPGVSVVDPAQLGTIPASRNFDVTTVWADDAPIDPKYSCKGANVSPPVSWSNVPEGTVEIAIVMTDPDANGFVHWAVAGLDPTTGTIAEGAVPATAVQAENGKGTVGYTGPCPPSGTHTYLMQVYALDKTTGVANGSSAADLIQAIEANATDSVTISGTFAA
jgi:Raf kinase inhibitor-like YbhB/YbcL family protein